MKAGIKSPATLQRDRTVTKLEAIEDRATGTWHFRFRFRDHSKKLKTIIVPGDVASSAGANSSPNCTRRARVFLPTNGMQRVSSMQPLRKSPGASFIASPGQDGRSTKTGPFGFRTETS